MITDSIISFFLGLVIFIVSLFPSFPAIDEFRDNLLGLSGETQTPGTNYDDFLTSGNGYVISKASNSWGSITYGKQISVGDVYIVWDPVYGSQLRLTKLNDTQTTISYRWKLNTGMTDYSGRNICSSVQCISNEFYYYENNDWLYQNIKNIEYYNGSEWVTLDYVKPDIPGETVVEDGYLTSIIKSCCWIVPIGDIALIGSILFIIFGGLWAFKVFDFVLRKVRGSG